MTFDAGDPNVDAAEESDVLPLLILPAALERELAESDESLGTLGRPFDRRAPFLIGLNAALGVAVAYLILRGLADITTALVIIGLALFIAIGLHPIIEFLENKGVRRWVAVGLVTIGFVAIIAAFILSAASPISHEVTTLVKNYPRYKRELADGKGWAGKLLRRLHLTSYLKGSAKLKLPFGGVLGAGKLLLSLGVATISVMVLTIYFLFALPGVKGLWLSLIPRSRRNRVELLTEEVFTRVGGFMLGNLLTSLIAGVGTYLWLLIFGVRYALVLGLFVALFDLIPMVGSTIAGIVVTLVALTRGVPIGVATGAFYIAYRYLEDYLLNPRVMKRTVKVPPGLTIVATLIGAALLGLVGALVAIPAAATIQLILEEVAIPRQNQR